MCFGWESGRVWVELQGRDPEDMRGGGGGEGPLPEAGVRGLSIEEGVQQDWFAVGCCGETSPARSPR